MHREATKARPCLNSGSEAGRTNVLRVRFTRSPPNVTYLGRWRENQPANASERFIRVGVRADMTMHRIPANGVRSAPAYAFERFGFDRIARVPTLAYRIASSFRPRRLVPIAAEERPLNPMKYASADVRNRSFRKISGIAIRIIGRIAGNIAGSIIIPKERKNTATNASRRGSSFVSNRATSFVSANTIPMKNAPMIAGIRNASARAAARKTIPRANRTKSSSLLIRSNRKAARGITRRARNAKNPMKMATPRNSETGLTGVASALITRPFTRVSRNIAMNDSRITIPRRNSVSLLFRRRSSMRDFAVIAELDIETTPARKIVSISGHPRYVPRTNPANMFTPRFTRARTIAARFVRFSFSMLNSRPTKNRSRISPTRLMSWTNASSVMSPW